MKHIITSAYHPQSNGALERSHSTLKDYLKHYINQNQTNWDKYIPLAMFSYNTHIHSSTKFTPYELLFGHKPILPSSITEYPELRYTYETYYDQLKYRLNRTHQIAKENLLNEKQKSKNNYDRNVHNPTYCANELVYLKNNSTKTQASKTYP